MEIEPIISMHGISKQFGSVMANRGVEFRLQRGEIHAIVGENGAGKSTLMKILYGLYQPDAGEISVYGQPVSITSPRRAMQLGLGMVQQHFTLIRVFTALQNIVLAKEPRKFNVFVDYQQAETEIAELAAQLGFQVALNTPVESLPIGVQQQVEILKVLYHGAEIVIMDEPTAVLAPQEIEGLFTCMRGLKKEGRSLIIITHKLDEVMAIADTVTVMRRGEVVASCPTAETDPTQLAELMLGEPLIGGATLAERSPLESVNPMLALENVTLNAQAGKKLLTAINLEVFPCEIVGIAGVEGNGQGELVEVLTGLRQFHEGVIRFKGKSIGNSSTAEIRHRGVAHLPADRHRHGISLNDSIDNNLIIGSHTDSLFCRHGLLDRKSIGQFTRNVLDKYKIRVGDITHSIKTLSGGNQQKVVVARELTGSPELIIAAHPTRGLDIYAARFVHERLIQARNHEKAVLLVSSELDELLQLSDRVAVMANGEIVGIVKPEETNRHELGRLMLHANTRPTRKKGDGDDN